MIFEQFWELWPGQRKGKQDARKAWTKVPPMMDGVIVEALLAQQAEREAYAKAGAWHSEWPLPATWLRGARWEDEITRPEKKEAGKPKQQKPGYHDLWQRPDWMRK